MKILPLVIVALLSPILVCSAQSVSTLYSFSGESDGRFPGGDLALSGSTLYGTTGGGGTNDNGTVFRIDTSGMSYQQVVSFTGTSGTSLGSRPYYNSVTLDGSTLFGMTYLGGSNGYGNVFSVDTSGTGFQNLLSFDNSTNGADPLGSLTLVGSQLFGMTAGGGRLGIGAIFSINSNGTGYQSLLAAHGLNWLTYNNSMIADGATLYGITSGGLGGPNGTIFSIGTDGNNYNILTSFTGTGGAYPGQQSHGSLILSGSTLYGMTERGGANNGGNIFSVSTDGNNFKELYSFVGSYPWGNLTLVGSTLYGTTSSGGANGFGSIFRIGTDGTNFQTVFSFDGINGETPLGSLTLSGSTLYGTTLQGGAYNDGTVYSFPLPEPSTCVLLGFAGICIAAHEVRRRRVASHPIAAS